MSKKWLERVSNVSVSSSFFGGVPWVLVDLVFFLICSMWPFAVAMEGFRCFMIYTVRLGQVVKWHFLMDWSNVFFTGLNRDT